MVGVGGVLFFAAYAVFLFTTQAGAHPTGSFNRIALGGSVGISLVLVGLVWSASRKILGGRYVEKVFAFSIAIITFFGTLITTSLATEWRRAYGKQLEIVQGLENVLPDGKSNSVILLDGICPYIGPGPVFESHSDVSGMLSITFRDRSVIGHVVSARVRLLPDRIRTNTYEYVREYAYGPQLFVYNHRFRKVYPLFSAEAAVNYFRQTSDLGRNPCLESLPGHGDELVKLGYWRIYRWWNPSLHG